MSAKHEGVVSAPLQDGGYSLIELLVVLAISAAIATTGMVAFASKPASMRLRDAAMEVERLLKTARLTSLRKQQTALVALDARAGRLRIVRGNQSYALPDGIEMQVVGVRVGARGANLNVVRFYPTGESSGAQIVISLNSAAQTIFVDWLTGSIVRRAKKQ